MQTAEKPTDFMENEKESNYIAARKRDWQTFIIINFLFAFGFGVYMGVFQNFLRDSFGDNPLRLGLLESLREIPGLLAALMAGTLVALAESRIAGLGLLITAIGVGLSGNMSGYNNLVMITVFWSIGFHLWAPVSSAITLNLSKGLGSGKQLGKISAVGATANLVALGFATLMSKLPYKIPYEAYFWISGVCIGVGALLCMKLTVHSDREPRARLIIRKEYNLFYLLTFLDGCRRQIFSIFASYTLIAVYHIPLSTMLILQFVSAALTSLTAPAIGKLIDRVGERKPLIFYSSALIVIFLGYASFKIPGVLATLFLIDRIVFSFSVGFTTYLHRIVRPNELTPCLSMGVTMNHIAAVTVPVGGAWLWHHYHLYQIPFWIGIAVAIVSLFATFRLPEHTA